MYMEGLSLAFGSGCAPLRPPRGAAWVKVAGEAAPSCVHDDTRAPNASLGVSNTLGA